MPGAKTHSERRKPKAYIEFFQRQEQLSEGAAEAVEASWQISMAAPG